MTSGTGPTRSTTLVGTRPPGPLSRTKSTWPPTASKISYGSDMGSSCPGSCIVVLHDLNMAARFCDRLVLLNLGGIVHDGSAEELLQSDQLARVYGIRANAIRNQDGLWILPTGRIDWRANPGGSP